jgi:hypothetical protein
MPKIAGADGWVSRYDRRRSHTLDAPPIQDERPIAERQHLANRMIGKQNADPLIPKLGDLGTQKRNMERIYPGKGLVQQQHRRPLHDAPQHLQPPTHPSREPTRGDMKMLLEAAPFYTAPKLH